MNKVVSKIFDRNKLIINKTMSMNEIKGNYVMDPLFKPSAQSLSDDVQTMKKYFYQMAYVGSSIEHFFKSNPQNLILKNLYICDICEDLVENSYQELLKINCPQLQDTSIHKIVLSEDEKKWPFENEQLDLIVNNLSMHWQNDPKLIMTNYLKSLEPDGAVTGSIFGDNTLQELRVSYTLAENERYGGVSQHMSPLFSITEMGNLLSRCTYNLPTVFSAQYNLLFDSGVHLIQFLQQLGESNCLLSTRQGVFKDTQYAALAIYDSLFKDENQKNTATFEIIHYTGWKYHESQARPKERGSAEFNMKDFQQEIVEMDPEAKSRIRSGTIDGDQLIEKNNRQSKQKIDPYK